MPGDAAYASRLQQIRPRLLTALRHWRAPASDCDDILQQAMVKLLGQPQLEHLASAELSAYATRTVIGLMRRAERTAGRRHHRETKWASESTAHIPTGEDLLAWKESFARWLNAVGRLSQKHQEVIIACDINELSHTEAAEALSLPLGTIKSRLLAARRALEQALAMDPSGESR